MKDVLRVINNSNYNRNCGEREEGVRIKRNIPLRFKNIAEGEYIRLCTYMYDNYLSMFP